MALDASMTSALALGSAALLLCSVAQADQLSCQDRLVSPGDATFEVRSLCGPPDAVDTRFERRTIRRQVVIPCATGRCIAYVEDVVEITIDEWTYDFGPRRFVQFLVFEQGKLVSIQAGGYGHKPI